MRGRDGNIHRGHPRDNELAMISHLGAMVSVTVGTLMAKRFRGEKNFVGLTCIGEGGMQTGAFHEGMNIAAVEQAPLVIVATNNHYAYSTSNDREFACDDLVERAIGYGFEGYSLDGTDLAACLDVIGGAVKRARAGRPPQLVVASVLRLSGHGEHDDASYVPEEMKRQTFARDCLKIAEQKIIESNLLDPDTLAKWRKDAVAQVDEAVATAQKEPVPEADKEDWCALSKRDLIDQPEGF
jgi:pyruvate dehydrogenase E1 component alpha subunit/2-oxoisovalerate dehydrogenase E1 component alpha subunit